MTENIDFDTEALLFRYIDQVNFLFFPEEWNNIFLEYSKNEILALFFIYKKKEVNMSEVAEYIHAPLNTATGVVTRLEKRGVMERKRDDQDKRVVKISLTDKGRKLLKEDIDLILHYIKQIKDSLTEEEKASIQSIVMKVMAIIKRGREPENIEAQPKKLKRITIE